LVVLVIVHHHIDRPDVEDGSCAVCSRLVRPLRSSCPRRHRVPRTASRRRRLDLGYLAKAGTGPPPRTAGTQWSCRPRLWRSRTCETTRNRRPLCKPLSSRCSPHRFCTGWRCALPGCPKARSIAVAGILSLASMTAGALVARNENKSRSPREPMAPVWVLNVTSVPLIQGCAGRSRPARQVAVAGGIVASRDFVYVSLGPAGQCHGVSASGRRSGVEPSP